eukprot:319178-Alexandrium_andersonii.AAC.1
MWNELAVLRAARARARDALGQAIDRIPAVRAVQPRGWTYWVRGRRFTRRPASTNAVSGPTSLSTSAPSCGRAGFVSGLAGPRCTSGQPPPG